MAHEIIAPWAKRVPDAGPMTADELLALRDDGWQHELVDGVLVRMPSPGYRHGRIVFRLAMALATYVSAHRLGEVVAAETCFLLSRPGETDTVLRPDIAFVRSEHVPSHDAPGVEKYVRLAPDLVVEVASPDRYKPEMAAKARLYLAAGVRLVWLVWLAARRVDVWRPGSDAPIASLSTADALDGLHVVPGFTYPLADLF
ncbi:MAG: Uma2 family endonuclease [Ktedonobacterales bacterium]